MCVCVFKRASLCTTINVCWCVGGGLSVYYNSVLEGASLCIAMCVVFFVVGGGLCV